MPFIKQAIKEDRDGDYTPLQEMMTRKRKREGEEKSSVIPWTLQQDNDPKHRSKKNQKYINRISEKEGFKIMEWPSQSPDLNPIENLWRYIKVRLRGKPKSKSKDALLENINNIWDNIPQSMFDTVIDSMPHRVKAVLEAKGGHTKY